jgi:NADH dehydrogenase [ubiquinone] 1 alpha subcomplex assembly factor 5
MSTEFQVFDRRLLVRRRDRAAAQAGECDFLLQRVADDLVERLGVVRRQFPVVLNLGSHHGLLGRRIRALPGVSLVIDADLSLRLVAQCPGPRLVADEEFLPFRDASLDLVVSGLSLQLVNDLPGALLQIRRALKPDGLLLAALLGGQSLYELRHAFLLAEDEVQGGASPRVAPFADSRDLGGLLQRAGFALPVADSDIVAVTYASPLRLMQELKAMGASNMLAARRRRFMTRRTLTRAAEIYVEQFGRPDGRVPATFEIITLTGWAPHESQQQPLRPGSARMRLADALGAKEISTGVTAGPAESSNR